METKTRLAKRLDTRSTALAIMKVSGGILIQPKSESKQLSRVFYTEYKRNLQTITKNWPLAA